MIKLLINNIPVIMDRSTQLRLEVNIPFFGTEAIEESFTFEFSLPTKENVSIFGHPHRVDVTLVGRVFPCEFYFAGELLFFGKFLVTKATRLTVTGGMIINGFSQENIDSLINALEYDYSWSMGRTAEEVEENFKENLIDFLPHYTELQFPTMELPKLYGENKEYRADFTGMVNPRSGSYPVEKAFLPCFYLYYVLLRLFKYYGYTLDAFALEGNEWWNLMVFNNRPLDYYYGEGVVSGINYDYRFIHLEYSDITAVLFETVLYDVSNLILIQPLFVETYPVIGEDSIIYPYGDISTVYTNSTEYRLIVSAMVNVSEPCYFWIEVYVYNNPLLQSQTAIFTKTIQIPANTDYTIFIDELITVPQGVYIFFSPHFTSVLTSADYFRIIFQPENSPYLEPILLQNHLPAISVGEFLNTLKNSLGLAFFFDFVSKKVQVVFKEDIYANAEEIDLTAYLISEPETNFTKNKKYSIDFDIKTRELKEYKDLTDTLVANYIYPAPSIRLNEYAFIRNSGKLLIGIQEEDENDILQLIAKPYTDYTEAVVVTYDYGDTSTESEDITLACEPMEMANSGFNPYSEILGDLADKRQQNTDYPLIFFFDREKITETIGSKTVFWRYASPFAYDRFGVKKWTQNISISKRFDDSNNLLDKLKDWLEMESKKTVTMKFSLSPSKLKDILQLSQPQASKPGVRKIRVGNMVYIPKKISLILSFDGIVDNEFILVPVV